MSKILPIIYAPDALNELNAIMDWNEKFYDREHADTLPEISFVLVRRGSSGYGHVAVYRRIDETIEVLHVFHTSQNWQQKLTDEFSSE